MAQGAGRLGLLSNRERQILELAASGKTDHLIASELEISIGTVNTYWSRIRQKQGRRSRSELVTQLAQDRAEADIGRLRAENAALLTAIAELQKRDSGLVELLLQVSHLVDTASEAMLVVDPEGTIRLCNAAAEAVFGHPPGDLAGHHLRELIPARYHGRHAANRIKFLSHPEKRSMGVDATTAIRRDGSEISILATIDAFTTPAGQFASCLVRLPDGGGMT